MVRRFQHPIGEVLPIMDEESFRRGYVAGWRSIRQSNPTEIPACPVLEAASSMYLTGFSRGVRDAKAAELGTGGVHG
jgi:hypothetical protein